MTATTEKLTVHLAKHGCADLVQTVLRIGCHAFDAVIYTQDGQRRAYVVGERPPVLKRKRKMALRVDHFENDWYVCAYMDGARITPENAPYHPCGANFLLGIWSVPSGEAIDAHNYWRGEIKPYLRIAAHFTEI